MHVMMELIGDIIVSKLAREINSWVNWRSAPYFLTFAERIRLNV